MALSCGFPPNLCCSATNWRRVLVRSHEFKQQTLGNASAPAVLKRCLRCNTLYRQIDNSPKACAFHGHTTGDRGLFALAPPHQGIDGEWSDTTGVIVYKWNAKNDRPNTGRRNWKKRWSCCGDYDENAPPCRRGWHVSYDDGFTLF